MYLGPCTGLHPRIICIRNLRFLRHPQILSDRGLLKIVADPHPRTHASAVRTLVTYMPIRRRNNWVVIIAFPTAGDSRTDLPLRRLHCPLAMSGVASSSSCVSAANNSRLLSPSRTNEPYGKSMSDEWRWHCYTSHTKRLITLSLNLWTLNMYKSLQL